MADRTPSQPTGAQVRGDIQAGLTGDKQPGFDPAMAPMETDAEAGGTPPKPGEALTARTEQRQGKQQEVSRDSGNAMRPVFSGNQPQRAGFWPVFVLILATVSALLLMLGYAFKS